jgi:zinc protease
LILQCGPSLAQSGRARERTGRPVPTPPSAQPKSVPGKTSGAPEEVVPIAPGAKIADQDTEGTTSRFILRNGLTLLVDEAHTVPLAAVHACVRTGDDPTGRPGLARLAGRMLLEGSSPRPDGVGAVRALGGTAGVDVIGETTELWVAVPAKAVESALEIHHDLLLAPAFDDAVAARVARGMADEENLRRLDPESATIETLMASVFATGPYRRSLPAVADATLRDGLVAFHRERYRPDRIVIVVSGDVSTFDVLTAVQRMYGAAGVEPAREPGSAAKPAAATRTQAPTRPATTPPVAQPAQSTTPAPPVPTQTPGPRFSSTRFDSGRSVVGFGYEAPAMTSDDAPAADLLAVALGGGRMSRLGRALRPVAGVQGVTARFDAFPTSGLMAVVVGADPAAVEAVEAAYFREVDRFRRERMSDGELQRARNLFERRFLDRYETPQGTARLLALFETQAKNFRAAAGYLQKIRTVTAADVQRVAARILSSSRVSVSEYLSPATPVRALTAEQFNALVARWAPDGARDVAATDVKAAADVPVVTDAPERRRQGEVGGTVLTPIPLAVRDFSTYNGPKAFVREDQSRPELAIGFFFGGGRLMEDEAENGITELMLRALLRGTKEHPGDALLLAIEQLGGEVRIVNESDFFGFIVEAPSRNADAMMVLMVLALENPAFDQAEILRERAGLLSDQLAAASDPFQRSLVLLRQARAANHAYGRSELGSAEAVAKLTDEKVRAWYHSTIGQQYPLVGIVGDTDGSSLISRHVADGFERSEVLETLSVPSLPPRTGADGVERRDIAATVQAIGCTLPSDGTISVEAFDVAAACAVDGILRTLSSKQVAFGHVDVFADRRRMENLAVALVSTTAKAEDATREAVLTEFARVAGAPDDVLDVGRAGAATAYRARIQDHMVRLMEYVRAIYSGAGISAVDSYAERVRAVTADAAHKAASVFIPLRSWRGVVRGRS